MAGLNAGRRGMPRCGRGSSGRRLVDGMRGRSSVGTGSGLNLRHVPEAGAPGQEPLEVDYDPWQNLAARPQLALIADRTTALAVVAIHDAAARPLPLPELPVCRATATRDRTRSRHTRPEMNLMPVLERTRWLSCAVTPAGRGVTAHGQRTRGTRGRKCTFCLSGGSGTRSIVDSTGTAQVRVRGAGCGVRCGCGVRVQARRGA